MSKHRILLIFISFFSLIILFVFFVLSQKPPAFDERQRKEKLENILGREARNARVLGQGEVTYQGKYFSLTYPAYVQVYDKKNPNILDNEKILEHFQFSSEDPKFRFVILVIKDDVTDLDELSAVRTRTQNKSYQKLPITIDGNDGLVFIKESDGVERSSFFIKDGRSYSFVITGVDAGELEKIYESVMQSLLLLK